MGGLQGWHLIILLLPVVAVVVIVLALTANSKQKQHGGFGPGGRPAPPRQIGYGMDGQPLYQQPVTAGTNVFAVLALVLGLFTGILGIVFGHLARAQIRRTGESGDGLAIAGLAIGYLWLAFWLLLIGGLAVARLAWVS